MGLAPVRETAPADRSRPGPQDVGLGQAVERIPGAERERFDDPGERANRGRWWQAEHVPAGASPGDTFKPQRPAAWYPAVAPAPPGRGRR